MSLVVIVQVILSSSSFPARCLPDALPLLMKIQCPRRARAPVAAERLAPLAETGFKPDCVYWLFGRF
ncbi:hypothetical protein M2360_001268 [Rhizobium sp. SG_E_25_P2]|uniref:hypothetical protein n=1 Tax=Rhizobium sp. SG_E_25_P2 TaxID=2879942 RepID=UPI002476A8D2|nr:hypothetical protein [Rhizobium sp. SG_E_25_P2]MDH6265872.1 hypothetical protein [Rhizobium sp. SG_E_25_P2]